MVLAKRTLLSAVVTVAAAVALALAMSSGRGCSDSDGSPEGAARAFVTAARDDDTRAVWELLGPATRDKATVAAKEATNKVGGARRYAPMDMIDVGVPASSYAPTDVILRERKGDTAVVDILGPDGRHDGLELVRVDGKWRVELTFTASVQQRAPATTQPAN